MEKRFNARTARIPQILEEGLRISKALFDQFIDEDGNVDKDRVSKGALRDSRQQLYSLGFQTSYSRHNKYKQLNKIFHSLDFLLLGDLAKYQGCTSFDNSREPYFKSISNEDLRYKICSSKAAIAEARKDIISKYQDNIEDQMKAANGTKIVRWVKYKIDKGEVVDLIKPCNLMFDIIERHCPSKKIPKLAEQLLRSEEFKGDSDIWEALVDKCPPEQILELTRVVPEDMLFSSDNNVLDRLFNSCADPDELRISLEEQHQITNSFGGRGGLVRSACDDYKSYRRSAHNLKSSSSTNKSGGVSPL